MARIQYVQLVDILGRLPVHVRSAAIDAGLHRLAELGTAIPAADRARLLARPLQPLTNARLVAVLVEGDPEAARAVIANASLTDAEWLALIPSLPVHARGVLRHRRDLSAPVEALLKRLGVHDRGLPTAATAVEEPAPEPDTAAHFSAPTGDIAVDQDVSNDVLELLNFTADPPPPTSLSEWARARAAQHREQVREQPSPAASEAGIGAIVRRIEEFRRARENRVAREPGPDAPRLPLGDTQPGAPRLASSLDFATDAEGRISWADGPHAPSVIGLALASTEGDAEGALASAIHRHLPLRGMLLHFAGAPAVSGAWQIDAVPRFHTGDGRFIGYAGRLRRPAAPSPAQPKASDEGDRLRQILHELRTPANAIQVAAEIIQQQLYGPAPHEYRALAAAIAGDCAHILAGFEELDRLARLETGALELEPGSCDLAQVFVQTVGRLCVWTGPRGSRFALPADPTLTPLPVALDRMEAERMVWRLLAALAGSMAPGETLPLEWRTDAGQLVIEIALPAMLAAREPDALFDAIPGERGQSLAAGLFGLGFSLRLATAEAAAAGGSLSREDDALVLSLPALTVADAGNSTLASGSL